MPLLELSGIHKAFAGAPALRGVDFDLRAGEVHALVGANGAGKSTLIKILAGACPRDAGRILLDGREVAIRTPHEAMELGIGVIYQEFNLVPGLTVAENVLLGQEPTRRLGGVLPLLSRRSMRDEAARHLGELGFPLDPRLPVRELSTGEKQLVEIARALYRRARILVLDEPTAALSRRETERLFALMAEFRERGLGMVYISHHLEEVFSAADRITVLRDGSHAGTWERGGVTEADLVRAMVGRAVEAGERRTGRRGETLLETEGLSGPGLRDVSLRVRRGEIVAVTGAAGAGQAELCWTLFGAVPARSGSIRFRGEPARWRSPREALRAGVALAPGDRKAYGLLPGLDVATNFTFAELRRWAPWGILSRAAVRAAAEERIRRYGVQCAGARQEAGSLSGGNQQKIVVGRAAERRAELYLFDEPTRGVDVGAREELYALIRALADGGAGVLVSTPDIQEALRLGDRVLVMRSGRLVYGEPAAAASEAGILAAIVGAES